MLRIYRLHTAWHMHICRLSCDHWTNHKYFHKIHVDCVSIFYLTLKSKYVYKLNIAWSYLWYSSGSHIFLDNFCFAEMNQKETKLSNNSEFVVVETIRIDLFINASTIFWCRDAIYYILIRIKYMHKKSHTLMLFISSIIRINYDW